ncbi:helix-turn-helix domain-containing protein [Undibacterium oligocarboniphilum]|uniref:Uncharacterized protein n=1 Tax=Undibacterium oligocarboniphilum TaxID=666702 RepID=A0A850QCY4_9BURK|nr:helix-turn-helix domain-containing protein [Undibacterium oligocarboniphilum]MBC3870301.1 hypothetical protein [Undibacterium oligocarboniphilum]NVO78292.1 hypothetical protein [Undibacterium oligocarboniphilum]
MIESKKQFASVKRGDSFTKLVGGVKSKGLFLRCGDKHISKLRKELEANNLGLKSASANDQTTTLLKVLRYLGERGINTKEGEGCGYFRIATRIQELEAIGHQILSKREPIVGTDGLIHKGIARYILRKESNIKSPQGELDFEVAK